MATSEDKNLSAEELREKYEEVDGWGAHPDFTLSDWKFAVTSEDTRRGYWEWVAAQIEEAEVSGEDEFDDEEAELTDEQKREAEQHALYQRQIDEYGR